MKTVLYGPRGKELIIGDDVPTVIIGERINPFGKNGIKEALEKRDIDPILRVAEEQISDGADALNISVGAFGIDETSVLPFVVENITKRFDVPLCLESRNPLAIKRALDIGCGKPLINSVSGETHVMEGLLPIIKAYKTAVVLIASDGKGIPKDSDSRLKIIKDILEQTDRENIPREDIIVDAIVDSVALNAKAALNTFETMKMVKREWNLNLILGASNISYGLPQRSFINIVFLSTAINYGLTCAITNPRILKPYIMASDLIAGKDVLARRYISFCKALKSR
ncbi:MAG TPA: dihydropteroate synthase [Syntrophorhabdaceae bacterium]|nr:dihydropteroate synthase [Syntrophorhabdaceae bacterium]HPU29967.1 dihydropteroate synthase [Syntrophorhabdaceae bacterium]